MPPTVTCWPLATPCSFSCRCSCTMASHALAALWRGHPVSRNRHRRLGGTPSTTRPAARRPRPHSSPVGVRSPTSCLPARSGHPRPDDERDALTLLGIVAFANLLVGLFNQLPDCRSTAARSSAPMVWWATAARAAVSSRPAGSAASWPVLTVAWFALRPSRGPHPRSSTSSGPWRSPSSCGKALRALYRAGHIHEATAGLATDVLEPLSLVAGTTSQAGRCGGGRRRLGGGGRPTGWPLGVRGRGLRGRRSRRGTRPHRHRLRHRGPARGMGRRPARRRRADGSHPGHGRAGAVARRRRRPRRRATSAGWRAPSGSCSRGAGLSRRVAADPNAAPPVTTSGGGPLDQVCRVVRTRRACRGACASASTSPSRSRTFVHRTAVPAARRRVTPHRWAQGPTRGPEGGIMATRQPTTNRTATNRTATSASPDSTAVGRNEVALIGRLAAEAEERELPSGDHIATLRVVVPREPAVGRRRAAADSPKRVTVDTIDIVCGGGRPGRAALRCACAAATSSSRGALRRRFFGGLPVARAATRSRRWRSAGCPEEVPAPPRLCSHDRRRAARSRAVPRHGCARPPRRLRGRGAHPADRPQGRLHTITLEPGREFHTHRGFLRHDDLIGSHDGPW